MLSYWKYFGLVALLAVVAGCNKKPESKQKAPPPATVHNAVKETDLATITLTAEAESRLGIETTVVERSTVARQRIFGGQVVSVSGRAVTVSAPMPGTLLEPENESLVGAGQKVAAGQPLCRLLLSLPKQDLLSVEEEAALRKVEYELAEAKVKRAQQLLEDKAGSARDLEDAQAQLSRAGVSLEIALARLEMLRKGALDMAGKGLSSLVITSPISGVVQTVHVASGQTVTNGTALLEIVGVDPVWVKVPIYVGDLATIDRDKPARVHNLGDIAGPAAESAVPTVAPLTADSDSLTTDLFYELSNTDLSHRPGQRVGVTLTLKASEQSLVIPYSAVVYDMYGSVWVYENTAPQAYVRRRVELRHVLDGSAILARGPAVGTKVVSAGAAELFGTEFGVGK